jgi:Ca2+-binding RTX toxin-like protein
MAAIIGSEGPDVLTETIGDDTIDGLGGDDVIILDKAQTSGTDIIDGGAGSDRLVINRGVPGLLLDATSSTPSIRYVQGGDWHGIPKNIESYTVYRLNDEGNPDVLWTGAGDDVYYFTAANNQTVQPFGRNFVDLGGGNNLVSIDASGVFDWGVEVGIAGLRRNVFVGSLWRMEIESFTRINLIGSALADHFAGLTLNDIADGRGGDDVLNGLGGDDTLIGGGGNDTLNGGEGDDVINFSTGTDTVDGGNGTDRLEIDARGVGGAVLFGVASVGGPYAGSINYAGGTVNYSGIENFTIYSNPGDYADDVTTSWGYDTFYHYGINSLTYAMDHVDLGPAGIDLLVADFSAVTDYAVTKPFDPLPNGHYLFSVGGNGKIDFTNVERIHFIGGAQGDTVFGLAGDDILEGRAGGDRLVGGDGNDDLSGGIGANSLEAGNGDDIIRSVSFGIDNVEGGDGFDTAIIDYSDQTMSVHNQSGGSIAYGNSAETSVTLTGVERIVIATGSGNDSIVTQGGNDEIRSGAGDDSIDGGAGNDYLDGGAGNDNMTGGLGDDIFIVDDMYDWVLDDRPDGGTDVVYASIAAYTLTTGVENLIAVGGSAHSLRGNGGDNSITGEAGNDFLLLQDGGTDTASGRSGNDVVYFGAAYTSADQADGGSGRDAFVLQGNYTVTLSGTSLTNFESVSLQSGANTQYGDVANNFYDFDITTANDLVPAGVQLIVNAQSLRAGEDFTFDGSAETDGRFLVYGGHGVDDLTGGAGVDVFFFEGDRWGPNDKVDGGGGRDAIVISAGSGLTHIEFGADSLTGIESISVNKQFATDPTQLPSYEFVLNNGNVAPGRTLIVNASSLANTSQTISVDGSSVHDGKLILFGGAGNDVLTAGDGADTLIGGGLADALTGGAGADIFRYDSAADSTAAASDAILDFVSGTDKIDLSRIDANAGLAGDQAFNWIGSNAFSHAAGELRAFASGGTWFVEGDTNGDGVADLSIAVTTVGGAALVQGDFLP